MPTRGPAPLLRGSSRFARRLSGSWRALVLVLVLAGPAIAPVALAHGGDHGEEPPATDPGRGFTLPPPPQGSAPTPGNRVPYYTYYQSGWLYGAHTVKVVPNQYIRDLAGDGDWLVWMDALSVDVYAYNIAAGDGFFVTEDSSFQQKPRVHSGVVVWEDKRSGPSDVLAYFTETGETRRLSRGGGPSTNHQNPSIFGTWVAWEDDRGEDLAVFAYDLQTNQELKVSAEGRSRDTDPVVVDHYVVYRTYRFNVWDLVWFDLETGESGTITADREMEQPPIRAGDAILFLKESEKGWLLHRWDPVRKLTENLNVYFQGPTAPTADGPYLVQTSFDGPRASFLARNLTSGASSRVTGYLPAMDQPVLLGRTLHVPVFNGSHAAIVSLAISPFAFLKQPRLLVSTPEDGAIVKGGEMKVTGKLTFEDTWGVPDFFAYGLNEANYSAIFPAPDWSFNLDLRKARPGAYTLSIEAHYREAPPIIERLTLLVPAAFAGTDIGKAGEEFHAFRAYALYYRYVLSNPAIVALAALAILVIALWIARRRLTRTPRRKAVVEYVRADDG